MMMKVVAVEIDLGIWRDFRAKRRIRCESRLGGGPEAGRRAAQKKSADDPELIALTVPEARRLLVRLLWSRLPEPDEVLNWSELRRAHQAFARRCHYKKRGAEPPD